MSGLRDEWWAAWAKLPLVDREIMLSRNWVLVDDSQTNADAILKVAAQVARLELSADYQRHWELEGPR